MKTLDKKVENVKESKTEQNVSYTPMQFVNYVANYLGADKCAAIIYQAVSLF